MSLAFVTVHLLARILCSSPIFLRLMPWVQLTLQGVCWGALGCVGGALPCLWELGWWAAKCRGTTQPLNMLGPVMSTPPTPKGEARHLATQAPLDPGLLTSRALISYPSAWGSDDMTLANCAPREMTS